METIIAAVITAVTSIVIAIIQAITAQKNADALRRSLQPAQSVTDDSSDGLPATPSGNAKPWWLAIVVLGGAVFALAMLNEDWGKFVIAGAVPLTTLFLAFRYPIPWGLAALAVAVLHGLVYLGFIAGQGNAAGIDLTPSLLVYIGNALLVSALAWYRWRSRA